LLSIFSQKHVEALEGSVQEKEKLNALLKDALDSAQADVKPPVQTTDIGVQSHRAPPEDEPAAHTEPAAPLKSTVAKGRADNPSKRFPKDRIRSPVRRGLRSHSPRTSLGDLMDSSLDNEMRAAGVDVNDSYDSSEGVGFSDTNVDSSVIESDHSLVTREDGGDPSLKHSQQADSSPHKMTAWAEEITDQAQANPSSNDDHLKGPSANGEEALSPLGEGLGGAEVEEEMGASVHGANSPDKGTNESQRVQG
jgi:hypothetical protein